MKKSTSILLLALCLLLVAAWTVTGFVNIPLGRYDHLAFTDARAITKGLDLSGGVYAVYQPVNENEEDLDTKIQNTMGVLRERLDNAGYTEATISLQGVTQIRIEIPNLDSPEEVLELIGEPALLEFVEPDGTVLLTGDNVASATAGVANGVNVVYFELDSEGTSIFSEATARLMGQKIAIVLDGEVLSDPTVNTHIPSGEGYIEGDFTADSAAQLASLIQSGALPLEIEQIEVRTISATLGVEALDSALLAALIGFCLLLVFMIAIYRLPGIVADVAMIIYIMIVLTCVAEFRIQLTLPGIAGIILGIGMAVDANVIIYERFKEEIAAGQSMSTALTRSYKKATTTILDANVTTIIAAVVLAVVGAGSVKGFAYTLIISILASMFTALVASRFLLKLLVGLNLTNPALYAVSKKRIAEGAKERRLPLMKRRSVFMSISLAIILVGAIFLCFGGFNLGIDFTGGTILTYNMGEAVDANKVEAIAKNHITGDMAVSVSDETMAVIRYQDKDADAEAQDAMRTALLKDLQAEYPDAEVENLERVGAVAGDILRNNALTAIAVAVVLMLIYIWIRFELLSGVAAIIALAHDVLIMMAVMVITQTQINSTFVAAVLTIVGYSINNTIVIFDRIRDNRRIYKNMDRAELVERSVGQSLMRTVNTTVTTLITITLLYILGVDSIKEFALPIIAGLLAGFYSATFLSAPLWAWLNEMSEKIRSNRSSKDGKAAGKGGKKRYVKKAPAKAK